MDGGSTRVNEGGDRLDDRVRAAGAWRAVSRETYERLRASADGGRLGVYAAIAGSIGAVPLPWIPDALVGRVRGALVHDIASRHGVSLAPEARAILSDVSGPDKLQGAAAYATQALR